MKGLLKLVGQTAILCVVFLVCDRFVRWTGWPIPANVLGIALLFTLLATGVIKEEWIQLAVDFLLRHLVFFFVPVAVGLMSWGGVFSRYGWVLLAAIVISTLLPLLGVGFLSRILRRDAVGLRPAKTLDDAGEDGSPADNKDGGGGQC